MSAIQFKTPLEITLAAIGLFMAGSAAGAGWVWAMNQHGGLPSSTRALLQSLGLSAQQPPLAAPSATGTSPGTPASTPAPQTTGWPPAQTEEAPELQLLSRLARDLPHTPASAAAAKTDASAAAIKPQSATRPLAAQAAPDKAAAEPPKERAAQASIAPSAAPAPAYAAVTPAASAAPPTATPEPEVAPAAGRAQAPVDSRSPAAKDPAEQHVSTRQAGIAALTQADVQFASGRVVSIGSFFPSGEKLISIDPDRSRIVTDRRTLVLYP